MPQTFLILPKKWKGEKKKNPRCYSPNKEIEDASEDTKSNVEAFRN